MVGDGAVRGKVKNGRLVERLPEQMERKGVGGVYPRMHRNFRPVPFLPHLQSESVLAILQLRKDTRVYAHFLVWLALTRGAW